MKHDVVYILKNEYTSEELRYSVRSVAENFPYRKIWFYGGKLPDIKPDEYVALQQQGTTKWEKVRFTLEKIFKNNEITEDFWLFNDDFFVLRKPETLEPVYNGDLYKRILRIEDNHGNKTLYSKQLRKCADLLDERGLATLNYAVHMPILVNRAKALEVLEAFPDCPMFRSLYGNYHGIGGVERHDCKISTSKAVPDDWDYVSTSDASFRTGAVGKYIRQQFPEPCKYEE